MLGKLESHAQKIQVEPLPHTIYKNQLKMDRRPKHKLKLLKENTWVNLHDLGFGGGFLDVIPKARAIKDEID